MNKKNQNLTRDIEQSANEFMTTNQGVRINDDQNSLKGGNRSPSLLEDFILREKITHFDHERIPERVVHARGSAAHGVFRVYESMAKFTRAKFMQDPKRETPVFVRFSTLPDLEAPPILHVMCEDSRLNSILKKAISIWLETTCQCSLYRMQSNFLT